MNERKTKHVYYFVLTGIHDCFRLINKNVLYRRSSSVPVVLVTQENDYQWYVVRCGSIDLDFKFKQTCTTQFKCLTNQHYLLIFNKRRTLHNPNKYNERMLELGINKERETFALCPWFPSISD
jgi:hypothetical protein